MARDNISEILDLKRSLKPWSKEPSEWADDRGEEGHEEGVEQERVEGHGLLKGLVLKIVSCDL